MTAEPSSQPRGRYVEANGLNIYYEEMGEGEPLLLLHGGIASTNALWANPPWGWAAQMSAFARQFRVIAPDTRGHGRTVNTGGELSYPLLADDVVALIAALGLERPLLCGFSDGGITGSCVAIRNPGLLRALVNVAGYDVFNPAAPTFRRFRRGLGGSFDATRADLEYIERRGYSYLPMLIADVDGAQGAGAWKSLFAQAFSMWTQPPEYTIEDLRSIAIPTLMLVGDRDNFCSVEEGIAAFRMLPQGEFDVLPNTAH